MRRFRIPLLALTVVAACALAPRAAHATVFKSQIPGAHYKANDAAQIELTRMKSRLRLNNIEGALDAVRDAARHDSLSGEIYDQLGLLYLRIGRYGKARDAFEQAAAFAPEQAPVWNRLAQVSLTQLGLEEQGLQALNYAFAADSTYTSAYYTEFLYHWTRCEFPEAARSIARARQLELDETHSLLWYSSELGFEMSQGDYASSREALEIYLGQAESDFSAQQMLAVAQRASGDPKAAKETLRKLVALRPQTVWLSESGLVRRALGERDSALVFFGLAVRADSSAFEPGYNKTLELLAHRDTTRAWRELARLRGIDPNNWLTPLLASRIARAEGDTARAALAFEEARRLNPAMGLASAARAGAAAAVPAWSSPELEAAETLIEEGDFALAGDKLYQAGRDKEHRGAALYWLARVARITGGAPGLPVIAAQAAAEETNGDPVVVRSLGEAQFGAGDLERAIANLHTLRQASPDDLVAAAVEAEARLRKGDVAGARGIFNEIGRDPTRSYRFESIRAAVLAEAKDPGAAIARQRAHAVDYLRSGS
jgi:tetratricopeptide (TPR) repeat protein